MFRNKLMPLRNETPGRAGRTTATNTKLDEQHAGKSESASYLGYARKEGTAYARVPYTDSERIPAVMTKTLRIVEGTGWNAHAARNRGGDPGALDRSSGGGSKQSAKFGSAGPLGRLVSLRGTTQMERSKCRKPSA